MTGNSINSTRRWDIVVVGGANTDFLVRGQRIPQRGETVQGNEFQQASGGKGANQALAAARLGAQVAFVGRVGKDDRGDALVAHLREEGVETRYVVRDDAAYTGVALVMVEEKGEKQIMVAPGANQRLNPNDIRAASEAIRQAKFVLTQLETSLEVLKEVAQLAHQANIPVLLDPAPPVRLPDEVLRYITVIKPNSTEARALTDIEVTDRASARRAAEALLGRGVSTVAIQAGEEGNLILSREGEWFMPRLRVKSVDATGAGDAFAAAFAVALAEGKSVAEAGRFANAAAALKTTVLGAQAGLPKREDVLNLLKKHPDGA